MTCIIQIFLQLNAERMFLFNPQQLPRSVVEVCWGVKVKHLASKREMGDRLIGKLSPT